MLEKMTAVCSEDSHLLPLLETLEDSSSSHAEQTDAYLSIANRLSGEDGKDFTVLVGGQFPRLCKVFKTHISSQNSDLSNAALQALGFCVFNNKIASGLSAPEIKDLLLTLNSIAVNGTDKNTCTRALWVISKQSFPHEEVGKAVPTILSTLESVLNKEVQSLVIEYEALNVIIRLLEQAPTQMGDEAVRWAKLIIPLVVHSAPKVRLRGATALEIGLPLLLKKQQEVSVVTEQLMSSKIVAELQKLFSSKNETYVLKLWPLFVRLLGKTLHRSGTFINSLLQLEELGFRSGSPAVKKIAFIAWKSLIDNFALNPDILCSTKRLKLLMQPLSSIHVRTEALALTKIEVWWYLLVKLGSQLPTHFEQVCLPLLQSTLCAESSSAQGTPLRGANQSLNTSTPLQKGPLPFGSPTTPKNSMNSSVLVSVAFPSIHLLGVEMILHFLLGPEVTQFANQHKLVLSLEPLQHPLIGSSSFFCKHAATLLNCVQDGFIIIGKDASGVVLGAIWKDMIEFVKSTMETGNKKERQSSDVLTHLLQSLKNIVMSDGLQVEKLLSLLECTVKGLPQKILGSAAYQVANMDLLNGTPALFLIQLHFREKLLELGVTGERFFINFETLVGYVLSGPTSPLAFSDSVLGELNQSAKYLESKEHLWRLWSVLINPLIERINQTNEVNQGDALEHNFSAMHNALMLPISHIFPIQAFPQATMKTLMRTWSELYKSFARCAALVTTTEENVCCEELCSRILSVLGEDPLGLPSLERIVQVITIIVECVNFSPYTTKFQPKTKSPHTPTDWSKRKKEPLGNLSSLLKLLVKVIECFHNLSSDSSVLEASTSPLVSVGSSIIGVLSTCISHIMLPSLIRTLFVVLTKPVSLFFDRRSESPKVYNSLSSKFDKLLGEIIFCLGSRYNGTFDSELLEALSPLLCAIFLHKNKQIRNQVAQFWNGSFAKTTVLKYPEELKPILNQVKSQTPLLLPGFTYSNTSEDFSAPYSDSTDNSQLETKISGIEIKSAGKRNSLMTKAEEIKGTPPRTPLAKAKLDFSSPKAKQKLLEEEQSVDFVFIPPETKERILTEHQKEVLRTKRVDIPTMYNNLDASQDTTLFSQYSQNQENSLEKPQLTEETSETAANSKEKLSESLPRELNEEKEPSVDVEMLDINEPPSNCMDSSAKEAQNTSNISNSSTSSDMVLGTPPQPTSRRQSFITLEKFENSPKSFSPLARTTFPKGTEVVLVPDSQEAMDAKSTLKNEEKPGSDAKTLSTDLSKGTKRGRKAKSSRMADETENKHNVSEVLNSESAHGSLTTVGCKNEEFEDTDCIPNSQTQELQPKPAEITENTKSGNDVSKNVEAKENTPPVSLNSQNGISRALQATANHMSLRRSSRRQSEILEGVRNESVSLKQELAKDEENVATKKMPQSRDSSQRQQREKSTEHGTAEKSVVEGAKNEVKIANVNQEDDLANSSQEPTRSRPRYKTRRSVQALLTGAEISESDGSETREETPKRKRSQRSKSKSFEHSENDPSESTQEIVPESGNKTESQPSLENTKSVVEMEVDVENTRNVEMDNKTYSILADSTISRTKTITADVSVEPEPPLNTSEVNKTYNVTKNSTYDTKTMQSLMTEPTIGDYSTAVSDVFQNSESKQESFYCPHKRSKRVRRSKSCDCCSEASAQQQKSEGENTNSKKKMLPRVAGHEVSTTESQFNDSVFSGPSAVSTPLAMTKEDQCFFKPGVSEVKSDTESEQENTAVPTNDSSSELGVTQVFVQAKAIDASEELAEDPDVTVAKTSEKLAEEPKAGTETSMEVPEEPKAMVTTSEEPKATETKLSEEVLEEPKATETKLSEEEPEEPKVTETKLSEEEPEEPKVTETKLSEEEPEEPEVTETKLSEEEPEEPEVTETKLSEKMLESKVTETTLSEEVPEEPKVMETTLSEEVPEEPKVMETALSEEVPEEPKASGPGLVEASDETKISEEVLEEPKVTETRNSESGLDEAKVTEINGWDISEEATTENTTLENVVQHSDDKEPSVSDAVEDMISYKTFDVETTVSGTDQEDMDTEQSVLDENSSLKPESSLCSVETGHLPVPDKEMGQSVSVAATETCAANIPENITIEGLPQVRSDTDSPPKIKGLVSLTIANDSPGGCCSWSPSASPSTSILKKGLKRQQEMDSPSPINKIRRVSFADPIYQEGLADDIDRRSPVVRSHSSSGSPSSRSLKMLTAVQPKLNTTPTKGFTSPSSRILGLKSSKKNLISEMTKESMPSPKESVYPALMNCTTPVDVILPQITSNMWARGLGQLIRAKNIKTIGDLSTLTPSEIKTLPVRSPKISTVKKALRIYHEQQTKAKGFDEFAVLGETEKLLGGIDEKSSSADEEKLATDLIEPSATGLGPPSTLDVLSQISALSLQMASEDFGKYSGSQLFEAQEKLGQMSSCILKHLQSRWTSPPHGSSVPAETGS
ncbi:telomere-associated protein RIF1 [Spea bombifrons]|uniref:telomere-associated protein RIF1 n=1 Tax=Spea bombifrons TaxID=233779 RepID=UPI00234A16B6|nr:telomere-associated protein RIF1 [Spea bombifrons]